MPKSPRYQDRNLDLDTVFATGKIESAWRKTVRAGLRKQSIEDLHDFLDVHWRLKLYSSRIRESILSSHYRPKEAEEVHLEKRLGITRRLLLPSPQDALVLQVLADSFEDKIKSARPSQNAYYSRSHDFPKVEDVDDTFAYPWAVLWPQFQQKIWKFTDAHAYVVNTDVANYYDTVSLGLLRNVLAGLGHIQEALLDFLFYMLEYFLWRPDYMPSSGTGLPQINFDAPRLLSYAFLFPVDRYLERSTRGEFVRWMDDINFGVDSPEEAKKILGEVQIILDSLGLKLNAGKTHLISYLEAKHYFWIQENRLLTIFHNTRKNSWSTTDSEPNTYSEWVDKLHKEFKVFYRQPHSGNWDKVLKRFLTEFGAIKASVIERDIPDLLIDNPSLRDAIRRYYLQLGYSTKRFKHVQGYISSGQCVDDASLFSFIRLIVDWKIPKRSSYCKKSVELAFLFPEIVRMNSCTVAAGLWLLGKYGTPNDLLEFVKQHIGIWTRSEWASRQVAAIHPLLDLEGRQFVSATITSNNLAEGLQVLAHLGELRRLTFLDNQITAYFNPPKSSIVYPLYKVIMARHFLDKQSALKDKVALKSLVKSLTTDEVLHKLLV